MIKIIEQNKNDGYCNVCQNSNKEKYYQLQFINPINQRLCVALCEECMNNLTLKLLKNKIEVEE